MMIRMDNPSYAPWLRERGRLELLASKAIAEPITLMGGWVLGELVAGVNLGNKKWLAQNLAKDEGGGNAEPPTSAPQTKRRS